MKIILIILAILVLVGGGVWFFFFKDAEPKVDFADTETKTTITNEFHQDLPESKGLKITNVVVLEPYSLADWSDENIGGTVVFKRDTTNSWQILVMDGGLLELESLMKAGVPEATAKALLSADRY